MIKMIFKRISSIASSFLILLIFIIIFIRPIIVKYYKKIDEYDKCKESQSRSYLPSLYKCDYPVIEEVFIEKYLI